VFEGARPPVRWVLEHLAERGLLSVLVEGGATVHASFITAGLADRVVVFVASRIVGNPLAPGAVAGESGGPDGVRVHLEQSTVRQLGEDVVIEGALVYSTPRHVMTSPPAGGGHF